MNTVKKEALITMIRDYAAEKKYELQYDYNRFDEFTTFYVNGKQCTVFWDETDNIFSAFKTFVKFVTDKMEVEPPRQIYLSTARSSGKSWVKEIFNYCCNDVEFTRKIAGSFGHTIKDVIFNDPATIVFWMDGSKTVVKCQEGDEYDAEKGLAMAICKKSLGNQGNYYNVINKWLEKYELEKLVNVNFELGLPDFDSILENVRKLKFSLTMATLDTDKKNELVEKIDRVLTAFDACTTSYGCVRCPYNTDKGKNCTSDRRVENIELLNDFRNILTKDDE